MDYQRLYDSLCLRGQSSRLLTGYTEKHHIIPKCMGGTNDKANLTILTGKEHFICHRLLVKIYPHNNKLQFALWRMVNGRGIFLQGKSRGYKITPAVYETCRIKMAEKVRILNTGYKHTLESKQKMSEFRIGTKQSLETIERRRQAHLGRKNTKETIIKMRVAAASRPQTSLETIIKLKAAWIKRKERAA